MISMYHPQIEGKTNSINKYMERYLYMYTSDEQSNFMRGLH
jgi:hypothetical protein